MGERTVSDAALGEDGEVTGDAEKDGRRAGGYGGGEHGQRGYHECGEGHHSCLLARYLQWLTA